MSEIEAGARPGRAADRALAASSPDDNTILMRMLRMLQPDNSHRGLLVTVLGAVLSGVIMLVYVVAKWGVPAILAMQSLIVQLAGIDGAAADQIEQQQIEQRAAAEALVLDGINTIGEKVDGQTETLEGLRTDVTKLQTDQAATTRRLNSVATQQQRMREALARQGDE